MADYLIQCSIFSVKHDSALDFSMNKVFFVNKPVTKNLETATSGNTGLNCVYCFLEIVISLQKCLKPQGKQ